MDYGDYFEFRRVDPTDYGGFVVPAYLRNALGKGSILDFGCGFGQMSLALRQAGYQVEGLDISPPAIAHCRAAGLVCHDGNLQEFFALNAGRYDFVLMSHVVEHFPKEEIIPTLAKVRELLKPDGALIMMVPNAQSHTGPYWAYEDFTHYTLFTAGSVYYVLRSAGFRSVEFLDADCTQGLSPPKKIVKKLLLSVYKWNYRFWNRVTSSAIHAPSPAIFSYEVKALARR